MSIRKVFSERLKALREAIGITQGEFAEALGVARATLSYYENGNRTPDIEFLDIVNQKTGCSLDYLMGYVDVMKEKNEELASNTELNDKSIEAIDLLDGGPDFKNFVFSHPKFTKLYNILIKMSAYDKDMHGLYAGEGYLNYKAYEGASIIREIASEAHMLGLPLLMAQSYIHDIKVENSAIELIDESMQNVLQQQNDMRVENSKSEEVRLSESSERLKQDIERAKTDPMLRFFLKMTGTENVIEELRKNGM